MHRKESKPGENAEETLHANEVNFEVECMEHFNANNKQYKTTQG